MVKVEDMSKEMDGLEGSLKAFLKAEKDSKDELSKKFALVVKELDAVKAELDEAKKGLEVIHKQATEDKENFLHKVREEGYDLGK